MNIIPASIGLSIEVLLDYPLASEIYIKFNTEEYFTLRTMYLNSEIKHIFIDPVLIKPSSVAYINPEEDDMYVYNVILNIP